MTSHLIWNGSEWKAGPPPPGPVEAKLGDSAVVNGKAYVFSAFGSFCFDPNPGTWSEIAPMPAMVVMPTALVVGTRIYFYGGMRVEGNRSGWVAAYDTKANRWHGDDILAEP